MTVATGTATGTNSNASVIGTFFPTGSETAKAGESKESGTPKAKTGTKAQPKAEKAKAEPEKNRKMNVAKKESGTAKATAGKAPKLQAKDKKITDYTLADARSRMRDANKESKTLSGALKMILSFWNEGYKDAFAAIGLANKDLTVPNIQKMWPVDLKVNGVFAYKTKVAAFTKSETGEKVYQYDRDGKKVTETVLKEFSNNFTPLRIFDALYYAQYDKKACVFQKDGVKKAS
jgi:hypothetical protein